MRINNYQFPKSSFLSLEKDLNIIIGEMMKNKRFQRLLYYTTKDALDKPDITEDQMYELFGKNIKTIPKLYIDGSVLNYIIISFDNFTPNATNPEFRDNTIVFDIICHFDQWQLNETTELRPYKLAAEIDTMFGDKRLTGIGKLEFLGASQTVVDEKYAGVSVMYRAIHGEEDKKGMPNPADDAKYAIEFDNLFNN